MERRGTGSLDGSGEGAQEIGFELLGGGLLLLADGVGGGLTLEAGDLAIGADDEGEIAGGGAGEMLGVSEQALPVEGEDAYSCPFIRAVGEGKIGTGGGLGVRCRLALSGWCGSGRSVEGEGEHLVVGGAEAVVRIPGAGGGGTLAGDGEGALLAGGVWVGGGVVLGKLLKGGVNPVADGALGDAKLGGDGGRLVAFAGEGESAVFERETELWISRFIAARLFMLGQGERGVGCNWRCIWCVGRWARRQGERLARLGGLGVCNARRQGDHGRSPFW